MTQIKNIVFDVGNVLVKWSPIEIIHQTFPKAPNPSILLENIFKNSIWFGLNQGSISEEEAIELYHQTFSIPYVELKKLMEIIKHSLTPIEGSIPLLEKLYAANYALYSITDNVKEIMAFLKSKYQFWDKFQGVVVSAEIGSLKPAKKIYYHLLDNYQLKPEETVFIDDYPANVAGARAVGMQAICFKSPAQCMDCLEELGVRFKK